MSENTHTTLKKKMKAKLRF